jgi:hypothetical protein
MPRPPRVFTLIDAMTLVGATAVGLAGTQHGWKYWGYGWFWNLDRGWTAAAILRRLPTLLALGLPALIAFTAAILALRLRRPRPLIRRALLQPGASACVAALSVVAVEVISYVASTCYDRNFHGKLGQYLAYVWRNHGFAVELTTQVFVPIPRYVGLAVMSTWLLLALAGRWRGEPSWVDRCGRLVGFAWLASALFVWLDVNCFNEGIPCSLGCFR